MDLVHVFRSVRMRRGPLFGKVVVLSLGGGLISTLFMLADPFFSGPLSYTESDQLVAIDVHLPANNRAREADRLPTVADWRGRTDLLAGLAAFERTEAVRFRVDDGAMLFMAAKVTEGFFDVLGVSIPLPPIVVRNEAPSLVLTRTAFERRWPHLEKPLDVIGRAFPRRHGGVVRIVGVLPATFVLPSTDVVFPIEALVVVDDDDMAVRGNGLLIGRLAPGITPEVLESALSGSAEASRPLRVTVMPLASHLREHGRALALGALASGALIFFICAGTLANLMFSSIVARSDEFATREAIGATRWDLTRLLGTELVVLAAFSAALGLAIAWAGGVWLSRIAPAEYLVLGVPTITPRVVTFTFVVCALAAFVSAVPGFVQMGGQRSSRGRILAPDPRGHRIFRTATVILQSGFAVVLVVGAALLSRSYAILVTEETGFGGHVLLISTSYEAEIDAPLLQQEIDDTVARLATLPGVHAAGAAVGSMLDRLLFPGTVWVDDEGLAVRWKQVTPGYFDAVGSTLVSGRFLDERDRNGTGVVVTDDLLPQGDSGGTILGERIRRDQAEIVGIIESERNFALDVDSAPTVFSLLENPWEGCSRFPCGQVTYVLGLGEGSDAEQLASRARQSVVAIDPDAVVFDTTSVKDRLEDSIRDRSFVTVVMVLLALGAISLSTTGLFTVVIFAVRRRTREIGVRLALGATAAQVLRAVLGSVMAAAASGIVLGLGLARLTSGVLDRFVYGIAPTDLPTSLAASVVVLISTVVAALIAATSALNLSPISALRTE